MKRTAHQQRIGPPLWGSYLRVSTGRQAKHEISLSSQREIVEHFANSRNAIIAEETLDAGASAWKNTRAKLEELIDRACGPDRPYDAIVVYSYSRFYRDQVELELAVRRLAKNGVELLSATEPGGNDPNTAFIRKIIGVIDEKSSEDNSKNVRRTMRENAKQGYHNGTTPPLGYVAVDAGRRGDKMKRRLEIDLADSLVTIALFNVYVNGDPSTNTPPLGIQASVNWLNENGYRTKKGKRFSVGNAGKVLRNKAYIGQARWGVRNARSGGLNDEDDIAHYEIPPLIDYDLFRRAQEKLDRNNPIITAPAVSSSPVLLSGILICENCGGTMSGDYTVKEGKRYNYYNCGTQRRQGKSVCDGVRVPMEELDELITTTIAETLLTEDRVRQMISEVHANWSKTQVGLSERSKKLKASLFETEESLSRLYGFLEKGTIQIDDILEKRIETLRNCRAKDTAALERIAGHMVAPLSIDGDLVAKFSQSVQDKLWGGHVISRRDYLTSVVRSITVGRSAIKVFGDKAQIAKAIGVSAGPNEVRNFVPKWRTRQDSNL